MAQARGWQLKQLNLPEVQHGQLSGEWEVDRKRGAFRRFMGNLQHKPQLSVGKCDSACNGLGGSRRDVAKPQGGGLLIYEGSMANLGRSKQV